MQVIKNHEFFEWSLRADQEELLQNTRYHFCISCQNRIPKNGYRIYNNSVYCYDCSFEIFMDYSVFGLIQKALI